MIEIPRPYLIGMIHLPPLPGSANHQALMPGIVTRAQDDAAALHQAGFDALMIENFGDAPFHAESIGPASVAAMAIVGWHVKQATGLPIGFNALRNDARSALGLAAAAEADFVRVNVHIGVAATDQGMIEGRAAETLRYRKVLSTETAIFADVHVKHATPVNQPDIAEAAREAAYRGRADALIVSGSATGCVTSIEDAKAIKTAVPDRPLLVGSGATAESIVSLLAACDGAIVGTHIKVDGQTAAPVDPNRARAFVEAVRRA